MGWPETDPVSISRSEIVRIERSLYRLELFHNRWPRGERKIDGVWPGGPIYFGYYLMTRFAPWENEQLACIHDYLIEALSSCT